MSKSTGNGIEPAEIMKEFGADILRLWAMSSNYAEDVRLGKTILNTTSDMYRRIRNTFRFLLGALDGFDARERVPADELSRAPELERYVLHLIAAMDQDLRNAIKDYDYNKLVQRLHHFCAVDLSAFYFDIRKDRLYCDRPDLFERRAARTVMAILLEYLATWFAPILSFTAEEVWAHRPACIEPGIESVHLRTFPTPESGWLNPALSQKWDAVRDIRRVVTGALEPRRADKTIGSSLEAHPKIYLDATHRDQASGVDWAETCITSQADVLTGPAPTSAFILPDVPGVAVEFQPAQGKKCARCWKVLPDVGHDPDYPDLSSRDADAVRAFLKQQKAA